MSSSGTITTVAGTGVGGYSGDGGAATAAKLYYPNAASVTSDGGYLIALSLDNVIRKVSAGGTITTVAGTGASGSSGDGGPASSATLNGPVDVAATADGGYLITDTGNNLIRKVSSGGTITTVAGTGTAGFSGDGGLATSAELSSPSGAAPTSDGGFLIVDAGNNRIRKVSSGGTITTVAGTGASGSSGDGGAATAAELASPSAVATSADGGFLIADFGNARVRRVSPTGTITTAAGTAAGYGGDGGAATSASLNGPVGIAPLSDGGFLLADSNNNRIRLVQAPLSPPDTTILTGPEGSTTERRPTFTFSATGPSPTFECSIDTGTPSFSPCSGPGASHVPAADLADGSYTFRVRATTAGGTDASPATRQFSITSPPAAPPVTPVAPVVTHQDPPVSAKAKEPVSPDHPYVVLKAECVSPCASLTATGVVTSGAKTVGKLTKTVVKPASPTTVPLKVQVPPKVLTKATASIKAAKPTTAVVTVTSKTSAGTPVGRTSARIKLIR